MVTLKKVPRWKRAQQQFAETNRKRWENEGTIWGTWGKIWGTLREHLRQLRENLRHLLDTLRQLARNLRDSKGMLKGITISLRDVIRHPANIWRFWHKICDRRGFPSNSWNVQPVDALGRSVGQTYRYFSNILKNPNLCSQLASNYLSYASNLTQTRQTLPHNVPHVPQIP